MESPEPGLAVNMKELLQKEAELLCPPYLGALPEEKAPWGRGAESIAPSFLQMILETKVLLTVPLMWRSNLKKEGWKWRGEDGVFGGSLWSESEEASEPKWGHP